MSSAESEMSFLDHLEELRWRIIKSLGTVAICAVPCGIYWEKIFELVMIYPLSFAKPKPRLIITSPAEAVMLSLKIAVVGGLIVASPIIFYQFWRFISPGLYKKERVIVFPSVLVSTLFFLGGIGFC